MPPKAARQPWAGIRGARPGPVDMVMMLHRVCARTGAVQIANGKESITGCLSEHTPRRPDVCTEGEIKSVAQAVIDSGLAAVGWTHINLVR